MGVVSADIALNLPDERASERTYQLLAQAVGRAGRGDRPGTAFIQTYRPEHRAIRAVVEGDAAAFYDEELVLRERFGSPPFGRIVKLTVAPASALLAAATVPPCAAIMERQMARPRPSPFVLVVRKGSNGCCSNSRGNPSPLSDTETSNSEGVNCLVLMVSFRRAAGRSIMASQALVTRFRTTWRN